MAEYIEREALIKATKKAIEENNKVGYAMIDNDFLDLIADAPAEDVEEVKHGKWEINCDGWYLYCSVCKAEPDGIEAIKDIPNFCANCGADMRGNK